LVGAGAGCGITRSTSTDAGGGSIIEVPDWIPEGTGFCSRRSFLKRLGIGIVAAVPG